MPEMILHKADTRGHGVHGWLNTWHSFSFADYHHPERLHFGALRVLNDDTVAAGMGFGTHSHANMEIISIPLYGDLEHRDSMGNIQTIHQGDVQVMSAGRGIAHSEFNKNQNKEVKFLQIWVIPNQRNVEPRYDQLTFKPEDRHNKLQQIVSPNPDDEGVWIHQDAWFHWANLDAGKSVSYALKHPGNGVYAFVIEGDLSINDQVLNRRDGLGITGSALLHIQAQSVCEVLLIEVPMI